MIKKLFMFLFVATTLLCNSTNQFKLGDLVWSQEYGWGIIVSTNYSNSYPLRVSFKNKDVAYTLNGKRMDYLNRSLFFQEIPIPEDCFKRNGEEINKPK
ncbi:MAG: hypothetical protein ACRDBY_12930 [Cetobacterium sp.]